MNSFLNIHTPVLIISVVIVRCIFNQLKINLKTKQKGYYMKNLHKMSAYAVLIIILSMSLTVNAQNSKVITGITASGNNSSIISNDIPENLNPGQVYTVSLTMVNNGKNKWVRGDNFFLKLYDEIDSKYPADVWGVRKVNLPNDVYPSEKVIFLFNVTAPQTPGVYAFRWAMTEDYTFFGEYTDNLVNVTGERMPPVYDNYGNNAEFVSFSIPETMSAGNKYKVRITLKNTGNTVWHSSPDNEYKLVSVTGSSDAIYPEWNSLQIYLSNSVEPGQISDIEFYLTAPVNPGVYNLQWIMKRGDYYFGQKTNMATVRVTGNSTKDSDPKSYNASFMEQNVPNSMILNEFQDISVTVSNTGTNTWIKDREQLVMIDAKKSVSSFNIWNVGYIQLPRDVEPGGLVTFNFKVKPNEKGWQYFQCSMMKDDGTLFGTPSKSVEVIVSKR